MFNLIQKHQLYNVIHDMIIELMDLDAEKTIGMLLEKNRIPPEVVVDKLKNHEQLLYKVMSSQKNLIKPPLKFGSNLKGIFF